MGTYASFDITIPTTSPEHVAGILDRFYAGFDPAIYSESDRVELSISDYMSYGSVGAIIDKLDKFVAHALKRGYLTGPIEVTEESDEGKEHYYLGDDELVIAATRADLLAQRAEIDRKLAEL